jgi:hypothetical protein
MVDFGSTSNVNRTVHLSNIIRAQYSPGRISLPQNGGLYARFKHVQGVPSTATDGGYSVSKLRMIDLLVERLVELKGKSVPAPAGFGDDSADSAIQRYAAELANALRSAEGVSPSLTAGIAQPGFLFSLVA